MLFFEDRDGNVLATMQRSSVTAAKEQGWTLFDGGQIGRGRSVVLAGAAEISCWVIGETKAQRFWNWHHRHQ